MNELFFNGIKGKLACPVCKDRLIFHKNFILCSKCGRRYVQTEETAVDLLPVDILRENGFHNWHSRQAIYSSWFRNIWNRRLALQTKALYDDYSNYIGKIEGLTLDIGCDTGNFKSYLNKAVYVGIDPLNTTGSNYSQNFMYELFPHNKNECVFIKGIGELLPFQDGVFDNVFINNVLDHVNRPQDVLSEAHRVLKNKGKLCIIHENPGLLRKISSKGIRGIFYSLINKILTLAVSGSIISPHKSIREKSLTQWLEKNFMVERRDSIGRSHIYLSSIKR